MPARGLSLISLMVGLALSSLLAVCGLRYYQSMLSIVKRQYNQTHQYWRLHQFENRLRDDLLNAGFMGCRWLQETPQLSVTHPDVATLWQTYTDEPVALIAPPLNIKSHHYKTEHVTALWLQRIRAQTGAHPGVIDDCAVVGIHENKNTAQGLSAVLWFLAHNSKNESVIYRKDWFGRTEEVIVGIKSWTWHNVPGLLSLQVVTLDNKTHDLQFAYN